MALKDRLDDIAEQLGHPRRPVNMLVEDFSDRLLEFSKTRGWPADKMLLIEEVKRLRA